MSEGIELKPGQTIERWAYAGRRVSSKGEPVDAWIPNEGNAENQHLFAITRGPMGNYAIGGIYEVTVTHEDKGGLTLHGAPRYTGDRLGSDERLSWEVQAAAARAQLAAIARERSDARMHALDEALEPLRMEARKLVTGDSRDAFIAYVIRRLNSVWYEKPKKKKEGS